MPLSLDFVKPKLRLADKGSLSPSELFPLDVIYSPFKRKYLLSNDLPTITDFQQNLDEMNPCKKTDHKKYEWAATGPGVRIKL